DDDESSVRDEDASEEVSLADTPEGSVGPVLTDHSLGESATLVDASPECEAEPDVSYDGPERCGITGHPCWTDPRGLPLCRLSSMAQAGRGYGPRSVYGVHG